MTDSLRAAHPARSAVWMGCSGWAYPSWRPEFYPAKTPQKKLLEAYAARLNSVEVNYTFRALPTPTMVEGWLQATPAEFRFSFKAPQRITHFSHLRSCGPLLKEFVHRLTPVVSAGRMGLILFQLPPNFSADAALLGEFADEAAEVGTEVWPVEAGAPLRMAFEFRNASWFADEIYRTLEQHGAALCVAESEELATPEVATAGFGCYRLRRSEYSPADLDALAAKLEHRSATGEVFAYFKHEEAPSGPLRAAAVLAALANEAGQRGEREG